MIYKVKIQRTIEENYYFDCQNKDEVKQKFNSGDWGDFVTECDSFDAKIISIK